MTDLLTPDTTAPFSDAEYRRAWNREALNHTNVPFLPENEDTAAEGHLRTCRWLLTTPAECEYRNTHRYCPHTEHACTCNDTHDAPHKAQPAPDPMTAKPINVQFMVDFYAKVKGLESFTPSARTIELAEQAIAQINALRKADYDRGFKDGRAKNPFTSERLTQ